MMALLLGSDSRTKTPKRIATLHALAALPDAVREVLKLDGGMRRLAEQLKDAQSLIFFGRGYNYSTALEAALKVCVGGGEREWTGSLCSTLDCLRLRGAHGCWGLVGVWGVGGEAEGCAYLIFFGRGHNCSAGSRAPRCPIQT